MEWIAGHTHVLLVLSSLLDFWCADAGAGPSDANNLPGPAAHHQEVQRGGRGRGGFLWIHTLIFINSLDSMVVVCASRKHT